MTPTDSCVNASDERCLMSYVERNQAYWRRNLLICVIGSFTTLVSASMLLPFLPVYVAQLGISSKASIVQWSGIAFGATFFGTAITAPIWGRLADRYGRKPMLVRAAISLAVLMSLIGMAHTVTQLVLLRFLAGLLGGYTSSSIVMIGTQTPKDKAGWALGVLSTGTFAGTLAGPLVGGFLPGWLGIRGTFFAGGAMISVATVATIFLIREDFDRETDAKHRAARNESKPLPGNRVVIAALLITASMVLLANMSIEPIITLYISQLGVPHDQLVRTAGIVMAFSALGSILTASRLGALADRIGSWRVIIGCLITTGLTMVPQAFVTRWWHLAVLRLLMGMAVAGLLPAIAKLIRHSVEDSGSGKMLGYLHSAQFTGQVAGAIVGGVIAAHFGLHQVFLATALLLALCAGLDYVIHASFG